MRRPDWHSTRWALRLGGVALLAATVGCGSTKGGAVVVPGDGGAVAADAGDTGVGVEFDAPGYGEGDGQGDAQGAADSVGPGDAPDPGDAVGPGDSTGPGDAAGPGDGGGDAADGGGPDAVPDAAPDVEDLDAGGADAGGDDAGGEDAGDATVDVTTDIAGDAGGCEAGGDCPPYNLKLINPVPGSEVCGLVTLEAIAEDDDGVAEVEMAVDGVSLGADTTAPYQIDWDTTAAADGAHSVKITARDTIGQEASQVVSLTVANLGGACDNLPSVTITAPAQGAHVKGDVSLEASASDDNGVVKVQFFIDNKLVAEDASFPYKHLWPSGDVDEGTYTLKAVAVDIAGQQAQAQLSFTVDRTPPSVAITAPADGALVGDGFTFTATATDPGLASVSLQVGAQAPVVLLAPPFQQTVDVSGTPSGALHLTATATDKAGNTATAARDVVLDRPPVVTVTAPKTGAKLSGEVPIAAKATDDHAVESLEWTLDGLPLASGLFGGPVAESAGTLDTTQLLFGPHTLAATATDSVGQTTTVEVDVTVDQPLTVSLALCAPSGGCSVPPPGTEIAGTWSLQAVAADDNGKVTSMVFEAGSTPLGTVLASPWVQSVNTATLPDGPVVFGVTAKSSLGIEAKAQVSAVVNNCDKDHDGAKATACGGGDCNDGNAAVKPGVPDAPGDGVDQDCDGADGHFCTGAGDCSDGDPCTDDVCDGVTGQCSWPANTAPCDDGDPCTTGDACQGGVCGGAPPVCPPGGTPGDACCPQCTTIEELRAMPEGPVAVDLCASTVTYVFSEGYFLQQAKGGPAMEVYVGDAWPYPAPVPGDVVTLKALTYANFNGQQEITDHEPPTKVGTGSLAGWALDLTGVTALSEDLESRLLGGAGLTVLSIAPNAIMVKTAGGATLQLYADNLAGLPKALCIGATFDVNQAVVTEYLGVWQIRAFDAALDFANVDDTGCTTEPEYDDSNWGFEDWTQSDPPWGFGKLTGGFTATQALGISHAGASSAKLTWTSTDNQDFMALMYTPVTEGQAVTLTAWFLDDDPNGRARLSLAFYGPGKAFLGNEFAATYTADGAGWAQYSFTKAAPAGAAYVRPFLRLYDQNNFTTVGSATVYLDTISLTAP